MKIDKLEPRERKRITILLSEHGRRSIQYRMDDLIAVRENGLVELLIVDPIIERQSTKIMDTSQ